MNNQELFKQAIADAKSVRDTAIANAKAALEETFTPKIMSMLSAKLNEEDEDLTQETTDEQMYEMEDESIEETDLEEILAQLEAEEVDETKKDIEEAKKKDNKKEKVEESLDEAEEDDEVTELTVDELKDIIRDVMKDVMDGEEESEEEESEEETSEEEEESEEEIDLDELLAEIEKDEVEEGKKEEVDEAKKKEMEEAKKMKKDLEEAIRTIKTLKAEINEVNLLNAKLLYSNKIFKAKNLSESQKVNVLKAFDKATNVKETKLVYESLTESINTKTRSTIKESVGFASKAVGVAPKQQIVESDTAIRRMQQLAGIIK